MHVLITSGGTKIPIDRVRHIGNISSGTFGSKIAVEALKQNCQVTFLKAKGSKSPLDFNLNVKTSFWKTISIAFKSIIYNRRYADNIKIFEYDSFTSYKTVLEFLSNTYHYDAVILAAAVSDFGVENYVDGKIRSSNDQLTIKLTPLPKIISTIKTIFPSALLIGFKLLVDSTKAELIAAAQKSVIDNKCDLVVANDLRDIKNNEHQVMLVSPNNVTVWGPGNNLAEKVITEVKNLWINHA